MEHVVDFKSINAREPTISIQGVDDKMTPWIAKAKERILSLAAGDRIAKITPHIMQIGFGKVLYAANEMGADIESASPYILFAPDGTCTYNMERIKRGFTYGAILDMEFDGLMATSNSMPNGCGFSMYELIEDISEDRLHDFLDNVQSRLGEDKLSQLSKGNHFAGIYRVIDPISGEDTNRRFVVVHCSGHAGGPKLYFPETWMAEMDGYHCVPTPHGNISLLEGEARMEYLKAFESTNGINAKNRDITMEEIFQDKAWIKLEEICHQGLLSNGDVHLIGTQKHEGLMPIAFNPEEGLISVINNPNLTSEFLECWDQGQRVDSLGIKRKLMQINITPHGGGYEFKKSVDAFTIYLNKDGVDKFKTTFSDGEHRTFSYFKEIRDVMTYRRRNTVMREVYRADLAKIIYENPVIKQIYPKQSIPGGSHTGL
ncbi:MAG: hypothetical protein INQ03_12300 [Candidatus Heimdallarchaeota archaeon]|nr:hypothetical protein [Candidatus Heimdallarchaeota archaeon]